MVRLNRLELPHNIPPLETTLVVQASSMSLHKFAKSGLPTNRELPHSRIQARLSVRIPKTQPTSVLPVIRPESPASIHATLYAARQPRSNRFLGCPSAAVTSWTLWPREIGAGVAPEREPEEES